MVKNPMDETKKGFMQNIGDLSFKKIDEANFEYSIKILENCLNTGGIAHGGFIGSIIAFIPSLVIENITLGNLLMEKNELLYAGVLSSGIAFLLQAYSQQNLSPAPVAIIFSLEGVFAAIFGWILLNQFLSDLKIFGIVLILIAVIFSQLAPIYGKKSYGRN